MTARQPQEPARLLARPKLGCVFRCVEDAFESKTLPLDALGGGRRGPRVGEPVCGARDDSERSGQHCGDPSTAAARPRGQPGVTQARDPQQVVAAGPGPDSPRPSHPEDAGRGAHPLPSAGPPSLCTKVLSLLGPATPLRSRPPPGLGPWGARAPPSVSLSPCLSDSRPHSCPPSLAAGVEQPRGVIAWRSDPGPGHRRRSRLWPRRLPGPVRLPERRRPGLTGWESRGLGRLASPGSWVSRWRAVGARAGPGRTCPDSLPLLPGV